MAFWDRIGDVFESMKKRVAVDPVGMIRDMAGVVAGNYAPISLAKQVTDSSVGQWAGRQATKALSWTERNVWSPPTDMVESQVRHYSDKVREGDIGGVLTQGVNNLLDVSGYGAAVDAAQTVYDRTGVTDALGLSSLSGDLGHMRNANDEYFIDARANDSSIMQTAWEISRSSLGNREAGFYDAATGKWVYPLIDDPDERAERERYFSRGAQRWVTGIGDATLSIALDPLNAVGGLAGAGVRSGRELTKESITAAANASRGNSGLVLRGAPGSAEVKPGSLVKDAESLTAVPDDAPRAYLRSTLGDDGVQSFYDEAREALAVEGDKTTALMSVLEKRGVDAQKVLDDARYGKGNGKLTAEDVLTSAGDDLMEKNGVDALFDSVDETATAPMFQRGADSLDPVTNRLGFNAKKYRTNVEKLTDYAWEAKGKPGTVAALADDYVLGQSSDTGAIADAMSWVAQTVTDERTAKGLMDDLQYAAAGDGGALRRIEEFNTKMALDVEGMVTLDRTAALEAIAASPLKTPAEKLAVANTDELFVEMRAAAEPELTEFLSKFQRFQGNVARVQNAGTLGGVSPGGLKDVGDIARVPLLGTFQPFKSLPPVRVLGGTHLPGKLNLDDAEATTIYSKWLDKTTQKLGLTRNERDLELTGRFRDDFVAAHDPSIDPGLSRSARANAAFRANQAFKKRLIKVHSEKHGVNPSEVEAWIDTALDVRNTELGAIVQGAKSAVEAGSATMVRLPQGDVVALSDEFSQAIGTPQFQEAVDLPDWAQMDEWLTKRFKPGYTDRVARGTAEEAGAGTTERAFRASEQLLEEANDAWKVLALTRLAYPLRVQMDTQARNLATFGALNYMSFLFKGVGNFAGNMRKVDNRLIELVQRKREAFDEMSFLLEKSEGENLDRISDLQRIIDMDLDEWIESGFSKAEAGKTRLRQTDLKKVQGSGEKVNLKTAEYERDRLAPYQRGDLSLQGTLGEGVQASVEGMYKSADAFMQKRIRKQLGYNWTEYGTSVASRKAWTAGYLEAVNHGLRNDAAWTRMLAGADDDTIIDWMRHDPEGKTYFRELNRGNKFESVEDLVARQRAHFDNLIPDQDKADIVAARDITADDLGDWFADDEITRPFVPTKIHETLQDTGLGRAADWFDTGRSKYFKFMAQLPETYMGRHPQYVRFHQSHMEQLVKSSGREKGQFTLQEVNELRKRADGAARKDMAKIMFDTSHKSNAGHAMRFLSPFFSAWEDTMFKWATIAADNPAATYNTLIRPFESLTSTGNVYDKDGNRIMPNGDVRAVNEDGSLGDVLRKTSNINEGYLIFTMPDWMTPGDGDQDFRLSRGSLNAIFQGDEWWNPGAGPVVQIAVNEAIGKAFPELYDDEGESTVVGNILDRVQPYGPTEASVLEQTLPAHMQHLSTLVQSLSGNNQTDGFGDVFSVAMQDELIRQRKTGDMLSEAETVDRVTKQTRNLLLLKWLGSSSTPASTMPNSRLDWYRKEFKRYQKEYGVDAVRQFQTDYPDFGEVTISLRKNETGVQAFEAAHKAADAWSDEMKVNPEMGWAFAGPDNFEGDFASAIYTSQVERGWRVKEDPAETFDRINIARGWSDWQTLTEIIDVELDKRGLTSLMSAGAEDLVALKAEAKAEIMRDNPSWAEEYTMNGAGKDQAVDFLNKMNGAMSRHPERVKGRQDLETLQAYIADRELAKQTMAEYGVASLPSEAELQEFLTGERGGDPIRYAIAEEWYRSVAEWKNNSPVFAQLYSRAGLERDSLENPVVVG